MNLKNKINNENLKIIIKMKKLSLFKLKGKLFEIFNKI